MAGSRLLYRRLAATGRVGNPDEYFDPLTVIRRARQWQLIGPAADDFPARYLAAVRSTATGANGVCGLNVTWSHFRFLTRVAHAACAAHATEETVRSDEDAVAAWIPNRRYVHLRCRDTPRQALRWYLSLHRGPAGAEPDFQEVRWLESMIKSQEKGWHTHFFVHGIDAHEVVREDFLLDPTGTVEAIMRFLGLTSAVPAPPRPGADLTGQSGSEPSDVWLEPYLASRKRLSATVGVRSKRD